MKTPAALRILVIEDDPRMVELLRIGLQERNHSVATATTAEGGWGLLEGTRFDALVLDIGLPDRSGYSILQQVRELPLRPAIVILSALDHEDHVVLGLEAGADDYIRKPFSFPELAARVTSSVRRTRAATVDRHTFGPFTLDLSRRRLLLDRVEVHVTRSEYLLLRTLAARRGEAVTRRQLMQAIWGTATTSQGALDTLVNTLRERLNENQTGLIATLRGTGYMLVEEADLPRRTVPS